jgi:hypothetical protein
MPCSSHLNGKAERVQNNVLYGFCAMAELDDLESQTYPDEWVSHFNLMRGYGSFSGKAPIDRIGECSTKTRTTKRVEGMYDPSEERLKEANHYLDFQW